MQPAAPAAELLAHPSWLATLIQSTAPFGWLTAHRGAPVISDRCPLVRQPATPSSAKWNPLCFLNILPGSARSYAGFPQHGVVSQAFSALHSSPTKHSVFVSSTATLTCRPMLMQQSHGWTGRRRPGNRSSGRGSPTTWKRSPFLCRLHCTRYVLSWLQHVEYAFDKRGGKNIAVYLMVLISYMYPCSPTKFSHSDKRPSTILSDDGHVFPENRLSSSLFGVSCFWLDLSNCRDCSQQQPFRSRGKSALAMEENLFLCSITRNIWSFWDAKLEICSCSFQAAQSCKFLSHNWQLSQSKRWYAPWNFYKDLHWINSVSHKETNQACSKFQFHMTLRRQQTHQMHFSSRFFDGKKQTRNLLLFWVAESRKRSGCAVISFPESQDTSHRVFICCFGIRQTVRQINFSVSDIFSCL